MTEIQKLQRKLRFIASDLETLGRWAAGMVATAPNVLPRHKLLLTMLEQLDPSVIDITALHTIVLDALAKERMRIDRLLLDEIRRVDAEKETTR